MGSYGRAQAEELLGEQGGESVADAERDCHGEHGEQWPPRGLCRVPSSVVFLNQFKYSIFFSATTRLS